MSIRKISIATAVLSLVCTTYAADGWVSLSDSLDAWTSADGKPIRGDWEITDGVIHRKATGASLYTKKQYENFILEFEWKISKSGNSGVKYRMKKLGGKLLGLEYQVIDDVNFKPKLEPYHKTGSIYDLLAAPKEKPLNPQGEWNTAKIVANGPVLEHWLNGVKVAELNQSTEDWKTRFAKSKYKAAEGFGMGKGFIHLQDHGSEVWFRNVRIKEL